MSTDPFAQLKSIQREGWALFAPLEAVPTIPAAQLVKHARRCRATHARCRLRHRRGRAVRGAHWGRSARSISPGVDRARQEARRARGGGDRIQERRCRGLAVRGCVVRRRVESLRPHVCATPRGGDSRDAPRLSPGGIIAFSTWPPEHFVAQMFALVGKGVPPPGAAPPPQWGDPNVVRQRLGESVTDILFDRGVMTVPAPSPQHYRKSVEETLGPVVKLVAALQNEPASSPRSGPNWTNSRAATSRTTHAAALFDDAGDEAAGTSCTQRAKNGVDFVLRIHAPSIFAPMPGIGARTPCGCLVEARHRRAIELIAGCAGVAGDTGLFFLKLRLRPERAGFRAPIVTDAGALSNGWQAQERRLGAALASPGRAP